MREMKIHRSSLRIREDEETHANDDPKRARVKVKKASQRSCDDHRILLLKKTHAKGVHQKPQISAVTSL